MSSSAATEEATPRSAASTKPTPGTQKKLTFSAEVSQKQGDKENLDNLAATFSRTSFDARASRLVSPGTFLRARGPVAYGEAPLTPGAALLTPGEPEAPPSRWTPSARSARGSDDDDDDDDDDDGDDDRGDDDRGSETDGDGDAAGDDGATTVRESFGLFRRQQAAIDAAALEPAPPIAIVKSAPAARTPAVPRYCANYRETPLTGESRESDWSPRSRSERGMSDDEDDRLLSP